MKTLDSEQTEIKPNQLKLELLEQQDVYENLNQQLSEQEKEQRSVLEARDILGNTAENLTDEQILSLVSEIQYLIDTWVEEFERKVYEGKTLKELLSPNCHEYSAQSK